MRFALAILLALVATLAQGAAAAVTATLDNTATSGTTLPVLTLSGGVDSYTVTIDPDTQSFPTVQFRTDADITRGDAAALTNYTKNYAGEAWDWYVNRKTKTIYIQGTAGQKVYAEIKKYPNH